MQEAMSMIGGKLTNQKGLTMVEAILALAIASGFLMLMLTWQKYASDDLKAKRSADYLLTFTQAASRYAAVNRGVLVRAMRNDAATDAEDFCPAANRVNLNIADRTSFTCVVSLGKLIEKNALPSSFTGSKNAYGQDLVAIFKLANPALNPDPTFENGGNQDIEMLVVATGGEAISKSGELALASELLGGVGGFVPPAGTSGLCPSGKDICGSGWSTTLADFGLCRKGVDSGCN